jgi:hypothetical protein
MTTFDQTNDLLDASVTLCPVPASGEETDA